MQYAYLNFPAGTVTIELLDTPAVNLWKDVVDQYSNFDANLMVNKGPLFHHGGEQKKERNLEVEQESVDSINTAIDNLNGILKTAEFPYRAYIDMPWQQTNLIHRAFTTGMSSYHTFVHNLTYQDLVEYQKYKYDDRHQVKYRSEALFKSPVEEGLFSYLEVMNTINKFVHHFEDVRFSTHGEIILKHLFNKMDSPQEIQMNWDVYDPTTGVKSIFIKHVPTYQEMLDSAREVLDDYDVYFVKSILGKDYETSFVNFDNPLEYDIQNIQDITGGIRILLNGAQKHLYNDSPFTRWCEGYGLDRKLFLPIPLGKIVHTDFDLNEIESDTTLPLNSDGSAGPDFKYRNPKIVLADV